MQLLSTVTLGLVAMFGAWVPTCKSQLLPIPIPTELPKATFLLKNKQSLECATIDGDPTLNDLAVRTYWCAPVSYELWSLVPSRKSLKYYQLKIKVSGKCLTVKDDGSHANNSPVVQHDCVMDDPNTLWTIKYNFLSIGRNFNGKTFELAHARKHVDWANANQICLLGFWSSERDNGNCPGGGISPHCSNISQEEYEFTKIFQGFN